MPVKTFTDNTALPASDINNFLTNGGLVYITQASWASGGTVSVNNCFTSTYSAYRLVVRNMRHATTDVNVLLRFRASGSDAFTAYYWSFIARTWGNLDGSGAASNTSEIRTSAAGSANAGSMVIDVYDPQKTSITSVTFQGAYTATGGEVRNGGGFLNNSTAYDGFSLIANSGNFTSLTVLVYGYREA